MVFKTRFFIKEKTGHNHLRTPSIEDQAAMNLGRLSVKEKGKERKFGEVENYQKTCRRLHFRRQRGVDSNYLDRTLQQFPNGTCYLECDH